MTRLISTLLASTLVLATPALAQAQGPADAVTLAQGQRADAAPTNSPPLRQSLDRLTFAPDQPAMAVATRPAPTPLFQPAPSVHRSLGGRIALTAMSVVGGLFLGGIIGAKLEPNCRCDDPGLKGFLLGAPIGAASAGVIAWKLSK